MHIYEIDICSTYTVCICHMYSYVCMKKYKYIYMHLHVTCKFFSTEDETTVKSNLASGTKTKIRGSDREWERLAGHES